MKQFNFRFWLMLFLAFWAITSNAKDYWDGIVGYEPLELNGNKLYYFQKGSITLSFENGFYEIQIDDIRVAYNKYGRWNSYNLNVSSYCDGQIHTLLVSHSGNYFYTSLLYFKVIPEEEADNGIYYMITGETATVLMANKYLKSVEISERYVKNGVVYPVTSIANCAFYDCSVLTTVNIPPSVTKIGNNAFNGCSKLTSITITNSVTSLGKNIFLRCENLEKLILGNRVPNLNLVSDIPSNLYDLTLNIKNTSIEFKFNKCNIEFIDDKGNITVPEIYLSKLNMGTFQVGKTYKATGLTMNSTYNILLDNQVLEEPKTKYPMVSVTQNGIYADGIPFQISVLNAYEYSGYTYEHMGLWYNGGLYFRGYADLQSSFIPNENSFSKAQELTYVTYLSLNKNNYSSESSSGTFYIEALKWETPKAMATSLSSARLMAEVNLSNYCTTAGIEWRRDDAPSNVASNEVSCPVVNGTLIGTLRNLRDDVYYKFRPYVTDGNGDTYYGEWVGFYTGDANVYFEPEVRTYAPYVGTGTVTFSGYALEGSENITEQGFEYASTGRTRSGQTTWTRVKASGILMSATVEFEDGEYLVRSYIDTSTGTFYGDEQTFTVSSSGVGNIVMDEPEIEIIGYYDLNGFRYDEPRQGFNIVVYSDGSTKKIIVRK